MIAPYPDFPREWQDAGLESRFARLQETIVAVRNLRAVYRIANAVDLKLHVRSSAAVAEELLDVAGQFHNLAKAELVATGPDIESPPASASFSLTDADGFVPLEGIVDLDEELDRQQKEAEKLRGHISGHEKKLANKNFVDRAPAHVVEDVRETLAGLKKQLESVEEIIGQLGG